MNRLRSITEFCPPGTQIKSPGGLSFDPNDVAGMESYSDNDGDGWPRIIIRWLSGAPATTVRFHRNVDGGTADVYGVARSINQASGLPPVVVAHHLSGLSALAAAESTPLCKQKGEMDTAFVKRIVCAYLNAEASHVLRSSDGRLGSRSVRHLRGSAAKD